MTDACLLLWLIIVSAVDVVRREVPPWLDLPALGLALACRALGGVRAVALTLVVWAVLFSLWEARVIGGGADARVLMVLLGLYPDPRLVALLGLALFLAAAGVLALRRRPPALNRTPPPEEERQGRRLMPCVPFYALAWAVFRFLVVRSQ